MEHWAVDSSCPHREFEVLHQNECFNRLNQEKLNIDYNSWDSKYFCPVEGEKLYSKKMYNANFRYKKWQM